MANEIKIDEESEVALTVRVPKETLDRIDALVKGRPTRIPRHSWLLEAIHEKLHKEERVVGDLEVRRENSPGTGDATWYRLRFLRRDRRKKRPVVPKTLVGDDCLERDLVECGCESENARGWIQKLRVQKSILIRDISVAEERVGRYGFRAPTGMIQLDLGDDKVAILFPDHALGPDGRCADRIKILAEDGHVERDAVVTPEGKILIILEDHTWPLGSPQGAQEFKYGDASKEETKEIFGVYRQFVPD